MLHVFPPASQATMTLFVLSVRQELVMSEGLQEDPSTELQQMSRMLVVRGTSNQKTKTSHPSSPTRHLFTGAVCRLLLPFVVAPWAEGRHEGRPKPALDDAKNKSVYLHPVPPETTISQAILSWCRSTSSPRSPTPAV